jgi:hypothetical protein
MKRVKPTYMEYIKLGKGKDEGKFHPRTGRDDPEGE